MGLSYSYTYFRKRIWLIPADSSWGFRVAGGGADVGGWNCDDGACSSCSPFGIQVSVGCKWRYVNSGLIASRKRWIRHTPRQLVTTKLKTQYRSHSPHGAMRFRFVRIGILSRHIANSVQTLQLLRQSWNHIQKKFVKWRLDINHQMQDKRIM